MRRSYIWTFNSDHFLHLSSKPHAAKSTLCDEFINVLICVKIAPVNWPCIWVAIIQTIRAFMVSWINHHFKQQPNHLSILIYSWMHIQMTVLWWSQTTVLRWSARSQITVERWSTCLQLTNVPSNFSGQSRTQIHNFLHQITSTLTSVKDISQLLMSLDKAHPRATGQNSVAMTTPHLF